ncbi:hypothetical protein [Paraurantiacibacter namhicola]|uniref:Heavy-metal-associated domain-containing protein n=1 Tax=Paraurantiacibacter namhicola TaxID=645517 RepID=A0A1C7DAP0_9SPHN|nr:hypothetical protein [Paraurantiacibacter namhicola]ANU08381.1 hypothetical protein A6F65_02094 [Paraurantiacibacter namhicola]
MTRTARLLRHSNPARIAGLAVLFALALAATALWAQVSGDRGIPPVASSTDIDVQGIEVDVTGDSPEDARNKGWQEAQRLAWKQLGGPAIPDSRLNGMVSAIVIEREQLGPRRYVATLGVIFDRQRAGGLLGSATGRRSRSAPMLTLPVLIEGGTATMFERRNGWQRAWAQFQTGSSSIDYVRPSGMGGESLLLTYGQTGRRSRTWWNTILDQFSAADVLIPVVQLRRSWPGGPVTGTFTARYGPDNTFLDEFELTAKNEAAIPAMYAQALKRFDTIFTRALQDGTLRPDPSLLSQKVSISPEVQALLEASRREEAARREAERPKPAATPDAPVASEAPDPDQPVEVVSYVVQFASPDSDTFAATLAAVRSTPNVRAAAVSSMAVGGTSIMRVSYQGSLSGLAAALRGRGFTVEQGSNALRISR